MSTKSVANPSTAFRWEMYKARIDGVTPLLQARMSEEAEQSLSGETSAVKKKRELPRDAAERHAYRDKDGCLVMPASAVPAMLRIAGKNHKQRTNKRSLMYLIAPGVRMTEAFISLYDQDGKKARSFEVDSRTGVNHNARGARILIHRPRLDAWSSEFNMRVNVGVIDPEQVLQLLTEAGVIAGLGAFRPERNGEFGTYQVTLWQKVEEPIEKKNKKALETVS